MTLEMDRLTRATFPHSHMRGRGDCDAPRRCVLRGWLDEKRAALEALTSIARAGADLTITYYAKDAARWKHDT